MSIAVPVNAVCGVLMAAQAQANLDAIAATLVFVSFLVLAGGLITLKSAGAGVGWGIQFQQPAFLALMAVALYFTIDMLMRRLTRWAYAGDVVR